MEDYNLIDDFDDEELSSSEDEEASFVCEECDYRWDENSLSDDWEESDIICPMCGSTNSTQL